MIPADKTLVNFDPLGRETPGISTMLLTRPNILERREEELLTVEMFFCFFIKPIHWFDFTVAGVGPKISFVLSCFFLFPFLFC